MKYKPTQPLRLTLKTLALSIALINTAVHATEINQDTTRLLPEVAPIVLDFKVPELESLKQNVYAGMLAIHVPEGINDMAIGAQVIHNNAKSVQHSLETQADVNSKDYDYTEKYYGDKTPLRSNFKTGEDSYTYYPCRILNATDCIKETLEQKATTQELLKRTDNALIMQRYLDIRQLPQYHAYIYTFFDELPAYQTYTQFSGMRLEQAIWAMHEGNVDKGFEILAEEMAFAKRVLSEDNSLIGTMISIAMLFNNYHTISALMDTPQMKPYLQDPRLLALLEPLTEQEQKALAETFRTERNMGLYFFYAFNVNFDRTPNNKENSPLGDLLAETSFKMNYDRYASVNTLYQVWEPAVQRANLPMNEIAQLRAENKLENLKQLQEKAYQEQTAIEEERKKQNPDIPGNYVGRSLIEFSYAMELEDYLHRFYDTQSYILLVNTKHQILSKELKADDIQAFLQTAGAAAQNPITREPFTWDAKEGTLSTPWLAKNPPSGGRGNTQGQKEMPQNAVNIKLAN